MRSIVHINEPEEVIWSSNAFALLPQRLRNPKAHMEQMNRAMQALQFDRPTNLQFLVEKVVKGDLDVSALLQLFLLRVFIEWVMVE